MQMKFNELQHLENDILGDENMSAWSEYNSMGCDLWRWTSHFIDEKEPTELVHCN